MEDTFYVDLDLMGIQKLGFLLRFFLAVSSFRKSEYGQGGPSRAKPSSSSSEASVTAAATASVATRALQNGTFVQLPLRGCSNFSFIYDYCFYRDFINFDWSLGLSGTREV